MSNAFMVEGIDGYLCEDCAETAAFEELRSQINNDTYDVQDIKRTVRDFEGPCPIESCDLSHYGEHCEHCGDEVEQPWCLCLHCGHTGYLRDDFEIPSDEGISNGDNGEQPTYPFCDHCADNGGRGDILLDDDGRGYAVWFMPEYSGEMTNWQPQGGYVVEAAPVYAAGCRRFTLADALEHWGPTHYTNDPGRRYYQNVVEGFADATPADRIARAILGHAMRRALPRIVIPAERAHEAALAAA